MHASEGTEPAGPERVRRQDPYARPQEVKKSPRPWFHAFSPAIRKAMRTALIYITVAYREAAERLKSSDTAESPVKFPSHTFPPGLPFVEHVESQAPG